MQKVIVIGCPGSGKSTFSKKLSAATEIPLYHLDMMYWNEDKTKVPKETFMKELDSILLSDSWIIDGNYGSTMEKRMTMCDTVFFLDYPVDVCVGGILERRGQSRSDMPWVEKIDEVDKEFLQFVKDYNSNSRPKVLGLLNKYRDKDIKIFKSREEANEFIRES